MRRLAAWAFLAAAMVPAANASAGEKGSDLTGGWQREVRCEFVGYDKGNRKLTVRIAGMPEKKKLFVAAALDRGPEGGLWVQAGSDLNKSGDVDLEAYDFQGKSMVYAALNRSGRSFLEGAQKRAAKGKPSSTKAATKAAVTVLCEFDVP